MECARYPFCYRPDSTPTHPQKRMVVAKTISPETIAAQAGGLVDATTGSIIPPIHTATTYIRDPDINIGVALVTVARIHRTCARPKAYCRI